jgi:hypothetical protein
MGTRVGNEAQVDAGPVPLADGERARDAIARIIRDLGRERGHDYSALTDAQVVDMAQYNLFPNITVLVFSDMLLVVRARPGASHEEAFMDVFAFDRHPLADPSPRTKPASLVLPAGSEPPLGLVLNQDVGNFERAQRGLHQPGLTHLTVAPDEECRVVNLHRNLEEYLGISPSQLSGPAGVTGP